MTTSDYNNLHNSQVECEVIGTCISDVYVFEHVIDSIDEKMFTDYDCVKAYRILRHMYDDGKKPDFYEIGSVLVKDNVSITKFMTEYHADLELTEQRIDFLRNLSIRRRVASLFFKGENIMCDLTSDSEEWHGLLKEIDDVINNNQGEDVQRFSEIVNSLMNDVAMRKEDKGEVGIMTGLHIFDARYGWHGGDLVIIAGETSMGKSTLATTVAYNMAVNGVPSAYYSMEMSAKQLAARIIARKTKVSSSMTLYDKLSDDDFNRVYDNTLELKDLPIYFDEDSKSNIVRIIGSARRMVREYGVKVIFIDYLQILANGHGDNREQLIGDMARDLKRFAVETDTVVVALSQLARSANAKEPSINRMRGSGQIEEACDIAVLISRPSKNSDKAKLQIAKGRNIGMASEVVKFERELSYFCDCDQNDPNAAYVEKNENLPF